MIYSSFPQSGHGTSTDRLPGDTALYQAPPLPMSLEKKQRLRAQRLAVKTMLRLERGQLRKVWNKLLGMEAVKKCEKGGKGWKRFFSKCWLSVLYRSGRKSTSNAYSPFTTLCTSAMLHQKGWELWQRRMKVIHVKRRTGILHDINRSYSIFKCGIAHAQDRMLWSAWNTWKVPRKRSKHKGTVRSVIFPCL